jgi:membrane fusion protein (multidrug efflux system)
MRKKLGITIFGLLAVVGVIVGIKALQIMRIISVVKNMVPPAETVTAGPVMSVEWQPVFEAVGSVSPVQGVTVATELGGKVVKIAFESGAPVQAGDLLVQLDTSTEEAQLRSASAAVDLARINLERAKDLVQKKAVSQSELDTRDAEFKQAMAQKENIETVIARKTVRAPFAGITGIRMVNLGQTVRDNTPVVSLQSLDPVYVDFTLPQQRLAELSEGLTVRVASDAIPDKQMEGKITAINPDVDTATRNVRIQATLANPGHRLRPGMFANVSVLLAHKEKRLVIPVTAVLYAPYWISVFVVEDVKDEKTGRMKKVLRQQSVRTGEQRGDFIAITSGLKEGETVVTSTVFKLRNKMEVVIDNTLAPEASTAPAPGDS